MATCRWQRLLYWLDPKSDWSEVTGRLGPRVAATVMHNGHEMRLRIDAPSGVAALVNVQLIALIIRAHAARDLLASDGDVISANRKRELLRTARAAFLAPDIVTATFAGCQPRLLSARTVDRIGRIPICWNEQRQMLGFI